MPLCASVGDIRARGCTEVNGAFLGVLGQQLELGRLPRHFVLCRL